MNAERLAANYTGVLTRIERACARAGRATNSVRLVAVTKYAKPEWIRGLIELGARDLGESRPQQLVDRVSQFGPDVHWHLIGPLQRNKVRRVLPLVELIHSIDSVRLLDAIDRIAAEENLQPRVLLEVNVSGEATKQGFAPEHLLAAASQLQGLQHVRIEGLMTMAPHTENAEEIRPVFRALRDLRDELAGRLKRPLPELSMGMSNDFDIAIQEGATIVRVGSDLFAGLDDQS